MTRCAEVTWDMRDQHYGESPADAKPGDLLWHQKGKRGGHVFRGDGYDVTEGWVTYRVDQCECGEAELGDHHVVILARGGSEEAGGE